MGKKIGEFDGVEAYFHPKEKGENEEQHSFTIGGWYFGIKQLRRMLQLCKDSMDFREGNFCAVHFNVESEPVYIELDYGDVKMDAGAFRDLVKAAEEALEAYESVRTKIVEKEWFWEESDDYLEEDESDTAFLWKTHYGNSGYISHEQIEEASEDDDVEVFFKNGDLHILYVGEP